MSNYVPAIGDYFVVKTKGWAGFLIRLGTFSRWNHAGIYVGGGFIVEARPVGVTKSELKKNIMGYSQTAGQQLYENILSQIAETKNESQEKK